MILQIADVLSVTDHPGSTRRMFLRYSDILISVFTTFFKYILIFHTYKYRACKITEKNELITATNIYTNRII